MTDRRLLIIEDDTGLSSQMRWCVSGASIFVAANAREAEALLRKHEPQVVILDLGLPPDPGGTSVGFNLLETIGTLLPQTNVIVITGREEHEHAVRAVANGAYDYYEKPINGDTLEFVVDRAFRLWDLEAENRRFTSRPAPTPLEGLITASAGMLEITRQIERVGPTDVALLIFGETGTGKALIARAAHELSSRRSGPFITFNCAGIPENLLAQELLGQEQTTVGGAIETNIGKLEAANGGTLLLDGIDEMPLTLQAKLLECLQRGTVRRLGARSDVKLDVRVVSTTSRSLREMAAAGSFREDLYFRISEVTVSLPPLRDRAGDVLLLGKTLVALNRGERNVQLSKDCMAAMEAYSWPGNIRELENRIKRACIMAEGRFITPRDLEIAVDEEDTPLNLKEVRAEAERLAIMRALDRSNANVSQAARLLGISRPTLYNLFAKHGLAAENHNE